MKIDNYIKHNFSSLKDKKIIITGANSGIGFEASKIVCSLGGTLIMACRNMERANKARAKILEEIKDAKIEIVMYDQGSFESITNFANLLMTDHKDFYALFLNAGIYHPEPHSRTKDDYLSTFGINFLGIYFLLEQLKDFLSKTKRERKIVIEGSLAARMIKKDVDYNNEKVSPIKQYSYSKYLLESYFYNLKEENKNLNIKYILCEPGVSGTNIIRNYPKAIRGVCNFALKLFTMSPKKASLTAIQSICNDSHNGDAYLPKGLLHVSGYPKKYNIKANKINKHVCEIAQKALDK